MSVVPMRMLTIAGPTEAIDSVICRCLVNRPFHPVEAANIAQGGDQLIPFARNNPYQDPLRTAGRLSEQLGIPLAFRDFRTAGLTLETAKAYLDNLSAHCEETASEKNRLTDQIRTNTQDIEDLKKFLELPSNLPEIYHLNYVRFRFGRMPREAYDSLSLKTGEMDDIIVYPTQSAPEFVYLVYVTPKSCEKRADNFMNSVGFERMRLTSHALGTPEETVEALESDSQTCRDAIETLDKDLKVWAENERQQFLLVYSYARFLYDAGEIKRYAVHTEDRFFLLVGWVPAEELETFTTQLTAIPAVTVADDAPEDIKNEKPPVELKNNFWGRLFQPFTEMYGLPAYNEFDPTFLLAVTYSILFGIMYGDVGQGVCLIALGVFLYKKKGMWLGGILGSVGVFSILFGFVFGSVFGYEDLIPGFHVLDSGANATRILIISAAIGVSLIAVMMVINIINGIKQHDIKKIFFTNNSVAGLVFYLAIVAAGVSLVVFQVNLFSPVYIIVLIVLPLLVMFCQEPLGKLANHEKDWKPDSIVNFFMENFFELFEMLLSFVTNTVSFLRVGAYAICHAGMMMVVYTLAGSGYNPVVLVLGNIIVMGIEGLLVCIQVLRLEFYEMFGRFYESGGLEFSPHMIDYQQKIEQ